MKPNVKKMNGTTGSSNSSMTLAIRILALVLLLIISIVVLLSPNEQQDNKKSLSSSSSSGKKSSTTTTTTTKVTTGNEFEIGTIEQIPYYYCSSKVLPTTITSLSTVVSYYTIILLHGSIFTKEDWRKSGILNLLCYNTTKFNNNNNIIINVYAFDLPVTASYKQLRSLLRIISNKQQQEQQQQSEKPKKSSSILQTTTTVLVTPSASGTMIYDWLQVQDDDKDNNNNNYSELTASGLSLDIQNYVHYWIPVACNKLLTIHNADTIIPWINIQHDGPQIIAIYGDQDNAGKRSSELLQQYVRNTKVYELPGRHPVYLDAPNEFVSLLLKSIIII